MSHHFLAASELGFDYPDGTPGLRGVTFRVEHGESVALVGPNGAGKSTLLLLLAACHLPSRGSLDVGGVPLARGTVERIRRSVGLTFQDADDQLFMPTVLEDVAFGPLHRGLSSEEAERRAVAALERVGAAHLRDRPPYRLSGGEKRAAAIAAVLALEPDVLVMDEPSAGLDPRARRRLIDLLRSFRHTKIVATHDLDLAWEVCDRTLVLHDGGLAADGPTARLLCDGELLARTGLERPLRLQGCPGCDGPPGAAIREPPAGA